jgi:hypothetical protein
MDKQTLEKMAVTVYGNLMKAADNAFVSAGNVIECKQTLDVDRAAALTSGKIDGKNEEVRKAQIREALDGQYQAVAECETQERLAMYNLQKAQIEVDTVKTLLRIAELAA